MLPSQLFLRGHHSTRQRGMVPVAPSPRRPDAASLPVRTLFTHSPGSEAGPPGLASVMGVCLSSHVYSSSQEHSQVEVRVEGADSQPPGLSALDLH